jgi:hypothetical protein
MQSALVKAIALSHLPDRANRAAWLFNEKEERRSPESLKKAHGRLVEAHKLADGGNRAVQPNARNVQCVIKSYCIEQPA